MTAKDLHQLIFNKWGCSYDLQLKQAKGKIYLQVMWKYLEQVSFPLSEAEYLEHLQALCQYLNEWGVVSQVTQHLQATRERPRLGKAVNIPLDIGQRASEWIID